MIRLKVSGLGRKGGAAAVVRAVQGVDPAARVDVDFAEGMVAIEGSDEQGTVTELFDRRHEGVMTGTLDTEFLDTWGSAPVPLAEIHFAPRSLPAG